MAAEQFNIKIQVEITTKSGYDHRTIATATVEDMGGWPVSRLLDAAVEDALSRVAVQVRAEHRRRTEAETEGNEG